MDKEIWKNIEGYEGLYQVSNFGRVNRLGNNKRKKDKMLKPNKTRDGYSRVSLYKNDIVKKYLVHRLVALAFILNPNNLPCVNHKDECKMNNEVNNLEWCTIEYNSNYGTRNKKIKEKMKEKGIKPSEKAIDSARKNFSKKVYQYDFSNKFIRSWDSLAECEEHGFYKSGISRCCNGKIKSHKGFIWSYKPPRGDETDETNGIKK